MTLALIAAWTILTDLRTRLLYALVNVNATALIRVQSIAISAVANGTRWRCSAFVLTDGFGAGGETLGSLVVAIVAVGEVVAHPRHVHALAVVTVEQMRLAGASAT